MLEPASDVAPGVIVLVLLLFADDLGRAGDVVVPDLVLLLHAKDILLSALLLGHLDHLKGVFVLRLPPLAESRSAVASPEQAPDLLQLFVLVSSEVLITGELPDVLEASLVVVLCDHILDIIKELDCFASMSVPGHEDCSQAALEMARLVLLSHQGHHVDPLGQSLVLHSVSITCLLQQECLLLAVLGLSSVLDKASVVHLILHLFDLVTLIFNVGLAFPVLHHCHQVVGVNLESMV